MRPAPTIADLPYTFDHLDALMEEAGLDALLITSKHNVQYLLGGYRFIFFASMDAIGHSRYLPAFVYAKGAAHKISYIGNRMEGYEHQVHPFWVPDFQPATWGSDDAAALAAAHLDKIGMAGARIGVEPPFLPMDARDTLAAALPGATLGDATGVMERLRAIKTSAEIAILREASERITDSMQAVISAAGEGTTKFEIIEHLRREEVNRGLHFDYCLLTLGSSLNRAASDQTWAAGEVLSIDSGGTLDGYIGDICRMGVLGQPDSELDDLLAEIEAVQQVAFAKIAPGAIGGDMIAAGAAELARQPHASVTDFFAHGMGIITHEVPFLMTNHPVRYDGIDADKPLQPGMVLSVETTMQHPSRGFIKLEDTVAVTDTGYELFGSRGRGWNQGGKG